MNEPQAGRPTKDESAATHHIHIRTTKERKNAYVKAAKPGKLTDWIVEHLDNAAKFNPNNHDKIR
jgi:hypothetical protein